MIMKHAYWACAAVVAVLLLAAVRDMDAYPPAYSTLLFLEQALIVALMAEAALRDLRTRLVADGTWMGIVALHAGWMLLQQPMTGVSAAWLLGRSALGSLALGGGILLFTLAYERVARRPAFGGGDVKLLFSLGFAFGWERGALMLLTSCLAFAMAVAASRLAQCAGLAVAPQPAVPGPAANVTLEPDTPHPFVPALAIGVYVVLLGF